jgi:hypothetical protein
VVVIVVAVGFALFGFLLNPQLATKFRFRALAAGQVVCWAKDGGAARPALRTLATHALSTSLGPYLTSTGPISEAH